jgi:hypothetical protein
MAMRRRGELEMFLVGNDGGYFCAGCPTVVLDHDDFAESAVVGLGSRGDAEFAVLGLVDLQAVPKEKSNVPLGADDNPVPLVEFTNLGNDDSKTGLRPRKGGERD